nr:GIY-YIG nuclease family protein [Nocardioides flavescens]
MTFADVMAGAGVDPAETLVIRHAYVPVHDDGTHGISAASSDEDVLAYTSNQSLQTRTFPASPPRVWVVFLPEGGDRARLWQVLVNCGETSRDETSRAFHLEVAEEMADLRNRLVIEWRSPRTWRVNATTAGAYRVLEIADAEPARFPGFDRLVLSHAELQAVVREQRYAAWRTTLASVQGIYLITDTRDGRHYVGKADGAENIYQRWTAYATNGHGGNVDLRRRDPSSFRFSVLRVFDPSTPESVINAAEVHYKRALDSVRHGMNGG